MEGLIIMIIGILMTTAIIIVVGWTVHVSMGKDHSPKYGWGSYKNFKVEFKKYKWKTKGFSDSLFSDAGSQIHADIFRFDNKGMIMRDPFSYIMCKIHIQRYIKKLEAQKNSVNWNKEQYKIK